MEDNNSISFDAIKKDALKQSQLVEDAEAVQGLFIVKSANKWIDEAKNRPIPKMLFSEFWHESELCILFADTNLGKSILAVQIANSISKGIPIRGFKLEALQQKVLYFDFELSDKQFEVRYSDNYTNHYRFNERFQRVEINTDAELPDNISFENFLNESLEKAILKIEARILIIDNITFLGNDNEKAKDALPLMKHLKALKKKYDLSILVLAHTPKRDSSKPITVNDIQGSKMLSNFTDSSFAIGLSHKDKSLRYIKQIKQRNSEQVYDAENIIVCEIDKQTNFLEFHFVDFGSEIEHLKQVDKSERAELEQNIFQLKKGNTGLSNRKIAEQLGTNAMQVGRVLKRHNL
ncbi:AAA family ATPase [Saccharicrinis aurantiacus]|uniref:AAA family ATPase n=1 Tax=Saccharicrinis aurantiacus TaxID=1849719 RepID=UPI000837BCAE|nr:AAA family ATPase [Saccharicrinis aurantiacus]